jgi:hypothetical protein
MTTSSFLARPSIAADNQKAESKKDGLFSRLSPQKIWQLLKTVLLL